ncbi:energy transducer TonB [Owenweeksia hongkongensis]|uniref:energy transducer TonB n=1 Tax=Owenweeksia hongkongensis TaxID=253245 RepID=UPI003A915248
MESKKSPKADLEKKSSMFFMVGIALSLLFVLMVFQYRQVVNVPVVNDTVVIVDDGPSIPRTVTPVKELVMPDKPKVNIDLPTDEPTPKPTLTTANPKITDEGPVETGVSIIGEEEEESAETVPFVLIEKMARPTDCQSFSKLDDQKACFNDWIKKYIGENTKYPEIGVEMRLEDRVFVTFIISEKGDVESAEIELGKYDALNAEALRVIKAMPKFVPGSQRNKPVKMKMTIPVNFKLSR